MASALELRCDFSVYKCCDNRMRTYKQHKRAAQTKKKKKKTERKPLFCTVA